MSVRPKLVVAPPMALVQMGLAPKEGWTLNKRELNVLRRLAEHKRTQATKITYHLERKKLIYRNEEMPPYRQWQLNHNGRLVLEAAGQAEERTTA